LDGWLPITAGAAFEKTTEKEHKRNATAAAVTTVTALYRTIHHGCFLGLLLPTPHCGIGKLRMRRRRWREKSMRACIAGS
jgi:hypothetical protein